MFYLQIGLVEKYGYSAEEHYVTTEDGYNLVIHRISGSPLFNSRQRRKVVFLQHGILCTSDCWVLIGAGKDLAFLLADKGYDVWLGNIRGNAYCRSHVKLTPRNSKFWQFSYHEVATRDLPAMIDYVLSYTNQKTLIYIGHSMGTTLFFALLSMKPEYNAKIKLGMLLAPVAIWKKVSVFLEHFRTKMPKIKKALPEILSYYPSGTSLQTVYHYYQNIITQKFQTYDYGYFENYKHYNQTTPLTYNLLKVTAPLVLFYGANDLAALKPNVLETSTRLPNIILLEEIPYKLFTHFDFLWATDAKTLLYDRVIEVLQKFDT
ncbi:hypothetical protein PUN28_018193 [Cardiocondyla obscurior]|uniref:Partial AB-hydrolase lipase domain-containing protein n=1 Tax=Cardiocondyla obscurior TaxID=286306 RepID=A0AAW2EIE8_9HYME